MTDFHVHVHYFRISYSKNFFSSKEMFSGPKGPKLWSSNINCIVTVSIVRGFKFYNLVSVQKGRNTDRNK
jgi:hypothetical protein